MSSFEIMYILRPDLSEDRVQEQVERYESFLKERGAVNLTVQPRGKRRLAYLIGKFQDGIYVQMNFDADGSQIAPLERLMRLSEETIRFLTLKLEEGVTPTPAQVEPEPETPVPEETVPSQAEATPTQPGEDQPEAIAEESSASAGEEE